MDRERRPSTNNMQGNNQTASAGQPQRPDPGVVIPNAQAAGIAAGIDNLEALLTLRNRQQALGQGALQYVATGPLDSHVPVETMVAASLTAQQIARTEQLNSMLLLQRQRELVQLQLLQQDSLRRAALMQAGSPVIDAHSLAAYANATVSYPQLQDPNPALDQSVARAQAPVLPRSVPGQGREASSARAPMPRHPSILDRMPETFPVKLYRLITEAEASGEEGTIRFTPDGKAFLIIDCDSLINKLAPRYFRLRSLASFRRQLYLYGFVKFEYQGLKGYRHDNFCRDRPQLLCLIRRSYDFT